MSDILICPWTPEHGRMQPAEGVYVRCSKCSAWARTVSAASVIRAIETVEAERDRLRKAMQTALQTATTLRLHRLEILLSKALEPTS